MIGVANKEDGYSESELAAIKALAPAIVESFMRRRAEEALKKSLNRFELLSDITGRLLQEHEPEKIVESLCIKVLNQLDCHVFFNFLADDNKGRLRLNAFAGIPEEEAAKIRWLDYGMAVCGCVAKDGCRIVAEHIPATPDVRTELVKSYGIKAYACHPLMDEHGKTIGTLSFGTKTRETFSIDDLNFMKAVTDQVAIAMNRMKDVQAIRESELRYRSLMELSPSSILIVRDGMIEMANSSALELFKVDSESSLSGKYLPDLFYNESRGSVVDKIDMVLKGYIVPLHEEKIALSNGEIRDVEVTAAPIVDIQGKAIQVILHDITSRKMNEEELLRLNRTLNALSHSSHALIRADDEITYLNEICRIIIEDCGYAMVWIGYAKQDENKSVKPVAHAGHDEGYIDTLNVSWADNERGQGPTGTAIRTGMPSGCWDMKNDPLFKPWCREAIKRGYGSSMVLPVLNDSGAFGAVSIYSKEINAFTENEVDLLSVLASDLAYGINSIRLRIENDRAEMAIRESLERLHLAHDAARAGAWEWDMATGENIWSEELYKLYGLEPGSVKPSHEALLEVIHPDDRQSVKKTIEEASGKYMEFDVEFRVRDLEGTERYLISRARPVKDEKLRVTRYIGIVFDITQRRLIEETNRMLAEIVESSEDAIVGKTLDGIITSWNKGAEQIYGYFKEDVIGKHVSILAPPELKDEMSHILSKMKNGSSIERIETKRMKKDGKIIDVSLSVSPIIDAQGKVTGASTIARDITDRKLIEQELIKTMAELERSNKELEQFAYIASHDLQEPLRMVSSFTQLLAKRYSDKLDKNGLEYIDFAVSGANRMQRLIQDLLAYSRVTSKKSKQDRIDLNMLLKEVLINLQVSIKESQAIIKYDKLPIVTGDYTRLVQVFQNLIANAIKFKGDKAPVIHISALRSGQEWEFLIKDNGIGIDPEYFERIFTIFQRLHAGQTYPGTGIGLALCKRIIEAHGGKIWVESEPGKGATFYFTLKGEF
jgi:PAS domain S-box-containing protein